MTTKELIQEIKKCSSKQEAVVLAKNEGLNISEEIIEILFNSSKEIELSDEELSNVTGGGCGMYADTYDGKRRPVKRAGSCCELYERAAVFMAVNQINQCSNCKYYSVNVDGRTISETLAWCTNDNRIEEVDYID